jgi:peptidylprolyl isomerase
MKRTALLLALAGTMAAAQTTATKPTTTAKTSTATKTGTTAKTAAPVGGVKVPPGIPVYRKLVKTAFALKYQDISLGTGALAEPLKLYEVKYTGWLAVDGKKFDSSEDHPGKEPIKFPQGRGRVIPGWDQAFDGMRIGGKRRIFIPYQLAYGAMGRPPVIPGKSDLIFDIELVSVSEMPAPGAMSPGGPGGMAGRPMPMHPAAPGSPTAPGATPAPASPAAPGTTTPPPGTPDGTTPKPADPSAAPSTPTAPSTPPTPPPADKPASPQQ